jgi:hypothetical protein
MSAVDPACGDEARDVHAREQQERRAGGQQQRDHRAERPHEVVPEDDRLQAPAAMLRVDFGERPEEGVQLCLGRGHGVPRPDAGDRLDVAEGPVLGVAGGFRGGSARADDHRDVRFTPISDGQGGNAHYGKGPVAEVHHGAHHVGIGPEGCPPESLGDEDLPLRDGRQRPERRYDP